MKLRKKQPWWDKFIDYIIEFRLLNTQENFKWNFFKYLWRITCTNKYNLHRLEESYTHNLVLLVLISSINKTKILEVEQIVGTLPNLENVHLMQAFKQILSEYSTLGYKKIIINIPKNNNKVIKLFEKYFDFEENNSKSLLNLLQEGDNNHICLEKILN